MKGPKKTATFPAPTPKLRVVTSEAGGRLETWRTGHVRDRPDGPAVTEYGPDGRLLASKWFTDGRLHRVDGPALLHFFPDGTLQTEEWWVHGNLSRLGGFPAKTIRSAAGNVLRSEFYVDGWHANRAEGWADTFAQLPVRRRFLVLAASPYAPLFEEEGFTVEAVARAFLGGVTTLDGVREVLGGAPVEWVRSFEEGERSASASSAS